MAEPGSHKLELRSAAFADHAFIPARFTRGGRNISPPLEWSAPPEGTVELALVCEDPDAPGSTFTHWVVSGIRPEASAIAEGQLPPRAVEGRNDFGGRGWDGPYPPVGDPPHRYFFRIFAVGRRLGLGRNATAADLRRVVDRQLASGTLVGLFGR